MEMSDLRALVTEDPARAAARAGDTDSIGMLWRLAEDEGEPKAVRKGAKKALYVLKSKGTDVERHRRTEKRPKTETGLAGGPAGERPVASFLSVPDSSGHSLLSFVLSDDKGLSHALCQVVVHPEEGVKNVSTRRMGKKQIDRALEETPDIFPVPVEYALGRLHPPGGEISAFDSAGPGAPGAETSAGAEAPARAAAGAGAATLPDSLGEWSGVRVPHPALELLPSSLSRIIRPDEEKLIFAHPEAARIPMLGGEAAEFRERIESAKESRLIVGNKSPEERVKDIVEGFHQLHFTAARREIYGVMLFDVALLFNRRGMAEEARILVDWGRQLLAGGPGLKSHPFVRMLVYREFMSER